jgi:hypothetical protein
MTVSSERTQRLPRDLALLVFGLAMALSVVWMGFMLLHPQGNSDALRHAFTSATFLIPYISNDLGDWAFITVLVWSLAHNFVDRRGATEQLNTTTVKSVFAVLYVILICGYAYGLPRFYAKVFPAVLHSSWVEQHGVSGFTGMHMIYGVLSLLAFPVRVLIVFAAFKAAISIGRKGDAAMFPETAGSPAVASSSSPRLVVALICGLFFVSLQIWLTNLYSNLLMAEMHSLDVVQLVSIWMVVPLVMGLFVAWGAWIGVSRPVQVRPFRALAATLLVLFVQQVISFVFVFLFVMAALGSSGSFLGESSMSTLTFVAGIFYPVVLVLLMFAITRGFYRSLQAAVPGGSENTVQWPGQNG